MNILRNAMFNYKVNIPTYNITYYKMATLQLGINKYYTINELRFVFTIFCLLENRNEEVFMVSYKYYVKITEHININTISNLQFYAHTLVCHVTKNMKTKSHCPNLYPRIMHKQYSVSYNM